MRLWAKTAEFPEGKFLVVRRDGSVPAWPHFVLGARDPAAPAALRAYADATEARDVDPDFVASIRELAEDFQRYRAAEGDGDPEAPPHRSDDYNVLVAMRGGWATIDVRPSQNKVKAPP